MRCLFMGLILALMVFPREMSCPNNPSVYWADGNVFNGYFTEPCETSYVVFWDGYVLKFSSYEGWRIDLPYYQLKEALEVKGRKVEDIAIKIHNHLPGGSSGFSRGDLRFMRAMRRDGFVGSYCLKPPVGKIRYRREKNVALIQFLKKKDTKEFLKEYKKKYPEAYQELTSFLKGQIK